MAINVALIGCGLIGKKRAFAIANDPNSKLVYAVDPDEKALALICQTYDCKGFSSWKEVISSPEIDLVLIATPNHLASPIAIEAIKQGKDIFLEKPFGKNASESKAILEEAKKQKRFTFMKAGFNHRFHPAIWDAKKLVDEGTIGQLFSIRARYGHGGRVGMETEWRSSRELCGSGELTDQGVHLIDLARWFAGDWEEVYGSLDTKFWKIDVEDNAYVIGKTTQDVDVIFHVSWTQWKNVFSFELFGSKGSIHVQGLGGSYGEESLELALRKPEGGKPDVTLKTYPQEDLSWHLEWQDCKEAFLQRRSPCANGEDGHFANLVIAAIERSHQEKARVPVT